ncbi:MAG: hypothetical protein ACRDZO_02265 [Egibacteraceae bacterium]
MCLEDPSVAVPVFDIQSIDGRIHIAHP